MWRVVKERIRQGHRTSRYPLELPVLPDRFRGLPRLEASKCPADCRECADACPTEAITAAPGRLRLDLGRCLFCTDCIEACPTGAIQYSSDHRLAARSRADLVLEGQGLRLAQQLEDRTRRLFGRSLKLRQVSAAGCNACEADVNVLGTVVFDLGRFGIQFVASPRHADGLLITGPVSQNMKLALEKTYQAVPTPRLVIAVGACAISGGPFRDHPEVLNGADGVVPVDLYIPGCPPHPWTILDGLLRLLGRLEETGGARSCRHEPNHREPSRVRSSLPMKTSRLLPIVLGLIALCMPACNAPAEAEHHQLHSIVVTSPLEREVIYTQQYVCQIHSRRNIEIRALAKGYLEDISVKEGQSVKQGQVMFTILPILYKAKLDAELAEAKLAELELNNTKRLFEQKVVSIQEVALYEAKLARAQAKAKLAEAELKFTEVKAPFDGIVDRLHKQLGSLIDEGDILTTLSDNSVMWVYFNVPEARYLEYMGGLNQAKESHHIELLLANGRKFPYPGTIAAIEAQFNNETGNIPFRADFPNPDGLLRHGQTGNVLIHRTLPSALVIPQRATFEILDKRYVYVVGDDHTVHQRQITIQHELDDIFVIASGLAVKDKIVLDGIRQVHDGEKVEYHYRKPEEVLAHLKHHAE